MEIITAKGKRIWVRTIGYAVKNDYGRIIKVEGAFQDISKLKNAEKAQQILLSVTKNSLLLKSLSDLLLLIKNELSLLIDTSNFFVALYNQEKDSLRQIIFVDEKDKMVEWKAENSLSGHVVKTRKTLLINKKQIIEILKSKQLEGTIAECWLGVPLLSEGKVVGVMVVQSYSNANAYDETSAKLLEMIAHELSVVIERGELFHQLLAAKQKAESNEVRVLEQKKEIEIYNERLESLLRIAQYPFVSIQQLFDFALEEAIKLTDSKLGYIYFYNEKTRQFTLNTWSKEVMKECLVRDPQTVYNLDDTGRWGEVVRQRKPIILNDYSAESPIKKGTPLGHIQLNKFLTIPIIIENKIVLVAGVANKESDYTQIDIRQLTLLLDNVWKISERISLVENLRISKENAEENEARFKALHNATFGGIAIHDNGIILDCNRGLSEITGYQQEELIGMNGIEYLIAEESRQVVYESISQNNEKPYEATGLRKNGEQYPLRLEARNIPYKGKKVRSVEFRDITDQKINELELIEAKENAEKSDSLKTAFINNISHEIRTPLNGILGFGQLMTEEGLSSTEREEYFHRVEQSSNRLLQTITDYMDISLIVSKNLKINRNDFNLHSLLETMYQKVKDMTVGRLIELKLEYPHKDPTVSLHNDNELIGKVLGHLLNNAVKFTQKGIISLGYKKKGDFLEFFVSDTGIGIPENVQEKIFFSFIQGNSTNTRPYEGNGLGLAISSRIVALLGGKIRVRSELEIGSTFYFTIPIIHANQAVSQQNYLDKKSIADPSTITILLAEDDEESAMIMDMFFQKYNFNAIFAANGKEAIEKLKENPGINLILMDLKMPVMDGYQSTIEIRTFNKQIPIIAQTAFALRGDKEMAFEAGCSDFIAKPIHREELLNLIRKYTPFQ